MAGLSKVEILSFVSAQGDQVFCWIQVFTPDLPMRPCATSIFMLPIGDASWSALSERLEVKTR